MSDEQILAHIKASRLRAVNVGGGTVRPRWRISPEMVEEFLQSRTSQTKPVKRRKRRDVATTTEFF